MTYTKPKHKLAHCTEKVDMFYIKQLNTLKVQSTHNEALLQRYIAYTLGVNRYHRGIPRGVSGNPFGFYTPIETLRN